MVPYKNIQPSASIVPVIISVPHCGTHFPEEIKSQYEEKLISYPIDTDWYVDTLYDFAPALGITMITAVNSRWVIDLNRDPENKPLYNDGRIITALCPITTFLNEPLYKNKRTSVDQNEINRRLQQYYFPYHQKLESLLNELKTKFGKVLLWDCHSIKQKCSIHSTAKISDLILGDVDGTSSSVSLINIALKNLGASTYSLHHNHPFKGGYITRYFGKPAESQHAIQLEMTKVNYMDAEELKYDHQKSDAMRSVLKNTFLKLIDELMK